ncbi:MAG: hypothetical protein M3487_02355 [Actinomycetota bacterium]|nr:hypothetical protein [Actinomycetota bacterium]
MMRPRAVLVAVTVALAACGAADPASSPVSVSPTSSADRVATTAVPSPPPAFVMCSDVPRLEAPGEWYRDEPVYVGNEMPLEDVREWAASRPGYAEIWIDRDHFGWITVAFTADAAARQAEVEAEFPGVGVVAVDVPTSLADLGALQEEVVARLVSADVPFAGMGTVVTRWRLGITVNAADERLAPALAGLPATQMCIEDTGEPVPDGPQPTEGDGWRLLGDELVGQAHRTGIATHEEQYIELWRAIGMEGARPAVDFETEVAIWFGAVYGSSCPIRLDDVVFELDVQRPLLSAVIVVPGGTGACTADANPHAYVVAVERDRLPPGSFAIQLGSDDPPLGAPEERTLVDADLSGLGVVATDRQIGPDPALLAAAGEQPPTVSGDVIEPGYPWRFELYVHCGIGVLGQLNGVWWMTDEGGGRLDDVPDRWAPLVADGEQTIVVEVLMTEGPAPTLTATAAGYSVTYHPVPPDAVPGCD